MPRNYEPNWFHPALFHQHLFLPGSNAAQRDTKYNVDCHSKRWSQEFTSTVKLHSNIISQLPTSGKLHRQYLQKQFCNDHAQEIPKECL